jgi:hypothetical protein
MSTGAVEIPLWPDNPSAQDLLGFSDIADPILDAVGRERLDPVAVGIFGDWGSGKSTVLEILADRLKDRDDVIVVFTRPWEYDPGLDPKATLIAEVLAKIEERVKRDRTRFDRVKERFASLRKRVQWSKAMTLVTKSAVTFSLPSPEQLVDVFSFEGQDAADPSLQGFRDEFAELMNELEEVSRVIVLVDDLDRCLPPTVVATLEAIKLFLSVKKMAFVVAADERLVHLAIADRYGASAQAPIMAREYVEKIIQIPVSVPALGLADTEAYLALLLIERHLGPEGEELAELIAHCNERRRSAENEIWAGVPDGAVPEAAADDVALAAFLAPVLYERLAGNPRRLKRFLNALWIRSDIAGRRGVSLDPTALAKLMVLEQLAPDGFEQLLTWLGDGTLAEKLRVMEEDEVPEEAHEAFGWWTRLPPKLEELQLSPYLRLAAALRKRTGPRSDLRADLRDIVDSLHGGTITSHRKSREKFAQLPDPDRLAVAREVVELMRVEPGTQEDLAEAVGEMVADPVVVDPVLDELRRLDASRIDAGLIIALTGEKAPLDKTRPVIREWLESNRLGDVQAGAAREALEEGGS